MIRTEVVDDLTWCCLLMRGWRGRINEFIYGAHFGIFFLLYGALSTTVLSSRVSRVGRVSKISVIWLRSKLALNKYRCE